MPCGCTCHALTIRLPCTHYQLAMHSLCTYYVQAKIDEIEEELTRTEAVADEEVMR